MAAAGETIGGIDVNVSGGDQTAVGMLGLELLADGKIEPILRELMHAPLQPYELERGLVSFPHATLMNRLAELERVGAISRERRGGVPPTVVCALTRAGRELIELLDVAGAWMNRGPKGESVPAAEWSAIAGALADGWSSGILRELAAMPRRGPALDERIHDFSHHQIASRLKKLANAGLVNRPASHGQRVPYEVTRWGREAVVVLARAARWERRHSPPGMERPRPVDAADGLLLAVPLVMLPEAASGVCALTIESDDGRAPARAVWVTLAGGRVVSATPVPANRADSWAHGRISDWCETLIEQRTRSLSAGGDTKLVHHLVTGLREPLQRC